MSAEQRREANVGERKKLFTTTREIAAEVGHQSHRILGGGAFGSLVSSLVFQKPELAVGGVAVGASAAVAYKLESDRQQRIEDREAFLRDQKGKKQVITSFWNNIAREDENAGVKRNLYDYAVVPTVYLGEYTFTQPVDQERAKELMNALADKTLEICADGIPSEHTFNGATFSNIFTLVQLNGTNEGEVGVHQKESIGLEHTNVTNPYDDIVEKVSIRYADTETVDGQDWRIGKYINWSRSENEGNSKVSVKAWEERSSVERSGLRIVYALSVDEVAALQKEILRKLPKQ